MGHIAFRVQGTWGACVCMYVYIYMYMEREREGGRSTDTENAGKLNVGCKEHGDGTGHRESAWGFLVEQGNQGGDPESKGEQQEACCRATRPHSYTQPSPSCTWHWPS